MITVPITNTPKSSTQIGTLQLNKEAEDLLIKYTKNHHDAKLFCVYNQERNELASASIILFSQVKSIEEYTNEELLTFILTRLRKEPK